MRTIKITRRSLGGLALAGAGVVAVGVAGPAIAKTAQNIVQYRGEPNGGAHCGNCMHWRAGNTCELVAGPLSPNGWCVLWGRKA